MAQNYTRQSSFADGDTITAALFNNEYNQLVNAFAYSSSSASSTGHRHDGTAGQGGNIPQIGDLDFLNKIVVDDTNNRWGFYVEVSSAAVEQIRLQDGALLPVTDSDVDLGTSSLYFKDAYIDSITTTGNVAVGGNLTVTGTTTFNGGTLTLGDSAADNVVFGADVDSNIIPDDDNTYDLGSSSQEWKDLYIDGTANIDTLSADTAAIGDLTSGRVVLAGTSGELEDSSNLTFDGSTLALTGAATVSTNLTVSGNTTLGNAASDTVTVTADVASNLIPSADSTYSLGDSSNYWSHGYIDAITTTGNVSVGGNLTVTGTTTFNGGTLTLGDAADDNVVFGADVNSNIIPNTDNTYDLGSSTQEWKDLYVDGVAYLDEINFNGTAITSTAAELNILDGVTSTAAELNLLDGVTATTAELNILDGVTSTAAELNILDGVTSTAAELNILDGVTSTTAELNILDGVTSTAAELNLLDGVTATTAELNILDGVTSTAAELNILDGKAFLDEDDMSSNSATGIASQQSIKAYVDAQILTEDTLAELNDTNITSPSGGALLFYEVTSGNWIDNVVSGDITITSGGVATIAATSVENSMLAGSIANAKLANSTVSYGGVSVALGASDATPAFDLSDATAYPGDSSLVTTGALNSGSITSGFGSIDVGSSAITTTGTVTGGTLAGTLSTAAQTNITSVGTLSSATISGDLTVDTSTLKVDSTNNRVGIGNASPDVSLDVGSFTDAIHVPVGTTAQRPGSPAAGYFRYNTTTGKFEGYTDEWGSIGGGSGTNMDTNIYTGDGSTTAFTLSTGADDENNLMVFIDGVFQAQNVYSVSGTTLTFATAPASGRVITVYHSTTTVGGSNNSIATMTGDGSDTTLTLSVAPVHENNVQVYFDGVYQSKSNYSISGTTLTFSTAPPSGVAVEAITATSTSSTTANLLLDADSDTKIQVEESSDEDKIRFDTGGTERMVLDSNGLNITTADNSDNLTLTSTDADAGVGPNLNLYRNSSSPADSDVLGVITFNGRNDNSEDVIYARQLSYITDASDGTEDGTFKLQSMVAGTIRDRLNITPSEIVLNEDSIDTDFRVESGSNANMLFVDGGNDRVGIGTASPTSELHIASASPVITLQDTDSTEPLSTFITFKDNGGTQHGYIGYGSSSSDLLQLANSYDDIVMYTGSSGTLSERMRIDTSGNVGIGTTSPDTLLHLSGADTAIIRLENSDTSLVADQIIGGLEFEKTDGSGAGAGVVGGIRMKSDSSIGAKTYLAFSTSSSSTNDTEAMRIDSSGNVGIGTASPGAKFHVTGTTLIDGLSNYTGLTVKGSGGSRPMIQWSNANNGALCAIYGTEGNDMVLTSGSSNTERMRIASDGHVMVGCTTTSASSDTGLKFIEDGRIFQVASYSNNAQESLSMYSTGASAFRFYVDWGGTIHATSTSITAISDERLKENIVDLETGLDEVLALKPRRFDWKSGDATNVAGFVAQEVEPILPDLIGVYKDKNIDDLKSIKMGDMIPTLVKAIQEQQEQIEQLKTEIQTLKGE